MTVVAPPAECTIGVDILHGCTVKSHQVQGHFLNQEEPLEGDSGTNADPTTRLPVPSHAMFKKETERL